MAIPTERVSGAIDVQLKALNSGGVMTEAYPITVVEDVIGLESKIQTEIASAGSIKFEVVDALPTTGQQANVIYLVPAAGTLPEQNIYDEYIWMVASGTQAAHWEIIGTTQTDVSNKMNKSGTYTNNHILLGLAGGTAIDGGKYLGSATFNGTPSNYMAREDGVVNYVTSYVSKRVVDATSSYKASTSAFGVVQIQSGGSIKVSGGVIDVPKADSTWEEATGGFTDYGTVRLTNTIINGAGADLVPTQEAVSTYVSAQIAAIPAVGPATSQATGVVQIGSNINVTAAGVISVSSATVGGAAGVVTLTNTQGNTTTAAATPALVSTALNGTSDHVVAYSAGGKLKDTGKVVGGATFSATPNASTLATEAGVSAYVAAASPKEPLAGYTVASSGVMYVTSSGGALTITSGGLNVNLAGYADGSESPAFGVIAVDASEDHGLSVTNGILSIGTAADTAFGVVYAVDYDDPYGFGGGGALPGPCVPTASAVSQYVGAVVRYGADGVPLYIAETTSYGVVKIGDHINVNDSGVISVSSAIVNGSAGVVKLVGTVGNATSAAITPAGVSSYVSTLAAGINAVAPLNDNITATGGTISISSATTTQSGAVLIMAGGTFTSAANKVATEGAVFSNCIFYSIV